MDPAQRYISWTTFMDSSTRDRLLPDVDSRSRRPEQRMLETFQRGSGRMLDHVFRFDLNRYVASELLQICDNMTMAHSLEARVPFCDVDLVDARGRVATRVAASGSVAAAVTSAPAPATRPSAPAA